jgi:hypothetical protein
MIILRGWYNMNFTIKDPNRIDGCIASGKTESMEYFIKTWILSFNPNAKINMLSENAFMYRNDVYKFFK